MFGVILAFLNNHRGSCMPKTQSSALWTLAHILTLSIVHWSNHQLQHNPELYQRVLFQPHHILEFNRYHYLLCPRCLWQRLSLPCLTRQKGFFFVFFGGLSYSQKTFSVQHRRVVSNTSASRSRGSGFESQLFLCTVCIFPPCFRGFSLTFQKHMLGSLRLKVSPLALNVTSICVPFCVLRLTCERSIERHKQRKKKKHWLKGGVSSLFSGGLNPGFRQLRNSSKLNFQSAFSSDSSMRASTQRLLDSITHTCKLTISSNPTLQASIRGVWQV